jgi:pimeloyl-ACP methyl ester carboxylesterase
MNDFQTRRRGLLALAASLALGASSAVRASNPDLPLLQLSTETGDIAYYAAGPEDGRPVILLHDLDGGIGSFTEVAAILAAKGIRVLVPSLRDIQPATIAKNMIGFLDVLHTPEAVFAGVGSGAHAANAFVALKPTRCVGLVVAEKMPESLLAFADAVTALVHTAKWRT